jgi:hypothetical protein
MDGKAGRALAAAGERASRLWALEALAGRGLLPADALAARAMRDRDPVVALWCAQQLVAPSGELPAATGLRLLRSARTGVRAFAAGQDPDLAVAARSDLLAWLRRDAATTYGKPDADQAAQIAELLRTTTLTGQQRREVAFVAGIRG